MLPQQPCIDDLCWIPDGDDEQLLTDCVHRQMFQERAHRVAGSPEDLVAAFAATPCSMGSLQQCSEAGQKQQHQPSWCSGTHDILMGSQLDKAISWCALLIKMCVHEVGLRDRANSAASSATIKTLH